MEQFDLTIVIVNYKVRELVRRLLLSLYASTHGVSFEVVVVDNASSDGVGELLAREFADVSFIANNRNFGFAAACNQAISTARGRHILLLNPDTELFEDAASALVRFADAHPEAGVVGPKILNADRTLQRSVLALPTPASQAAVMLKLHHLFPRLPAVRRYFQKDFAYEKTQPAGQVIGAAFLISQNALATVGLLDPRYFIWFEEVDYCKRVKDSGLEVWFLAEAAVIHHGGQSFAQLLPTKKQRYFNASLARYMRKHFGIAAWILMNILRPSSLALAWGVEIFGLKRKKYA